MERYKIRKRFISADREEYLPGDIIELENALIAHRMKVYGYIEWKPIKGKKRGRKKKVERAVTL